MSQECTVSPYHPSDPAQREALGQLFKATHQFCFCRYWHYTGDKAGWFERIFQNIEDNEREFHAQSEKNGPDVQGLLAWQAGQVVGWLKLVSAGEVGKLYGQRFYRGLPIFEKAERAQTLTVGCILVAEAHRRSGVASKLIAAVAAEAKRRRMRFIEALPRRVEVPNSPEALQMGPLKGFLEAGFEIVEDAPQYPILRLDLGPQD